MKKILLVLMILVFSACGENKYDFNASGPNGRNYSLSDFKGENILIYFGYTLCADVCPTSMAIASEALKEMKRDDIKIIFISLDTQRDTPDDTTEFVQFFYKNSIGLVPNKEELKRITKNYGAKYELLYQDSAAEYTVAHSSSFYIIDKDGHFKGEISNLAMSNVKKKISKFLN